MKSIALFAITVYQRYVSPFKGYCCAYGSYTGRRGCSALGYRAIRRYGVWQGLKVLDGRFERCRVASDRLRARLVVRRDQRGFCDIGCPCDLPACDLPSFDCVDGGLEVLNCCSSSPSDCWGGQSSSRARRQGDDEKYVYIPPGKSPGNEESREGDALRGVEGRPLHGTR